MVNEPPTPTHLPPLPLPSTLDLLRPQAEATRDVGAAASLFVTSPQIAASASSPFCSEVSYPSSDLGSAQQTKQKLSIGLQLDSTDRDVSSPHLCPLLLPFRSVLSLLRVSHRGGAAARPALDGAAATLSLGFGALTLVL